MTWFILHSIGIMAYAATGALVALESNYSFIGVFVLGLATSFGGSIIRNLLIGAPITTLWDGSTLAIALGTLTFIVLIPYKWFKHWKTWGLFFDSIGLASFALQGAMSAAAIHVHTGLIFISALFTGLGGGMIRDLFAQRRPLALKEEIHAILTLLCGACVWLGWTQPLQLTITVFTVVSLRMLAIKYQWHWHLPCNLRTHKIT
ncbi:UPF0126 membrane protein YvgT [Pullulanibacillus camelliae]|uniref:UPF0126 membrane protein YvgT n=1 Tax=Pullulanibacillus camelliae TaxID=1707096 RepID=A0A8J2YCA5_9BACL|nr:TRIC cation channel family protein [Pullulanibacillus camelliae]GGE30207.1 UPF0126 membrane protein YvgT [Pullulanibacillus camelliae]